MLGMHISDTICTRKKGNGYMSAMFSTLKWENGYIYLSIK